MFRKIVKWFLKEAIKEVILDHIPVDPRRIVNVVKSVESQETISKLKSEVGIEE